MPKTLRGRLVLAVAAVAVTLLLLAAAWSQRTTALCEDAIEQRRTEAEVARYCQRWGF